MPLANIEECRLDELPAVMRYGGAGIHFMSIGGRYRASFNFLEHPRIVIALKRQAGPVRDISFSTRRPDDVLRFIGEAAATQEAAPKLSGGWKPLQPSQSQPSSAESSRRRAIAQQPGGTSQGFQRSHSIL